MRPACTPSSQKCLRGFSLGEVLLAAFILTAGLLSVTALLAASLRNSVETRDVIIAAELAQEGIELVRNIRDNDFALGNDGFTAFNPGRRHCRIDYDDPIGTLDCNPSQGAASRYSLQYASGMYAHMSALPGRFSRYIYIRNTGGTNPTQVRSFVYWSGAALPPPSGDSSSCTVSNNCVFTEVELTDWKQ